MKWLALLFFIVLAEGSDDRLNSEKDDSYGYDKNDGYDDDEKISELKIVRPLIVDKFKSAALTFPPPTIEFGECGAEKFKEGYVRVQSRWNQEISSIIYHQANAAGRILIEDIKEKFIKLELSIQHSLMDGLDDSYVEKDLRNVVEQLWTFLDLKPGDRKLLHAPIPQLPTIPTRIVSQTKNRTASNFFLYLPEFYDEDLASMYGYLNGIFLSGWHNARKYFHIRELEFRNQILNGWVLRDYRKYVQKIFKSAEYIEGCVSKETWESFRAAGIRIIEISNEWQETLEKLENEEQSS